MADKSFGVKELNLLGSSGTPSIESPNDLNLNANTVAISTNLTVGSKLSVTSAGIVTAVSGVVTYYGDGHHLTGVGNTANIITDSLIVSGVSTLGNLEVSSSGILTAKVGTAVTYYGDGQYLTGISAGNIPGIDTTGTSTFEDIVVNGNAGIGSLNVTGISTFGGTTNLDGTVSSNNSLITVDKDTWFKSADGVRISTTASSDAQRLRLKGTGSAGAVESIALQLNTNSDGGTTQHALVAYKDSSVKIYYSGNQKLETSGLGVTITGTVDSDQLNISGVSTLTDNTFVGSAITMYASTGIVSATAFYGDGSNLSGIATAGDSGFSPDAQQNLYAGTNAGAASDADTCFNIGIGYSAGNALNAGDSNIFLGQYAGQSQTTATNNIFIGRRAGQSFVSGGSQVFIGNDAGRKMCDGYQNVAIGYAALRGSNTVADNDGEKNIALGTSAGEDLTGGDHNVLLGSGAGKGLTTGIYNIFIGGYGGQAAVVGRHNIAMGRKAGRDLTCGDGNIFLGEYAGASSTLGDGNIFIGCYAGTNMVGDPANRNVLIGDYAGCSLSTGCYNVAIGCGALKGTSTPADNTGHNNIAIGCKTAHGIKSGAYNILFGKSAGCAVTDGNLNIFIGKYAGCTTTTGSCNIAIGCMVHLPSVTDDNQLAIGKGTNYWITGNADFNVGIGTTNPNAAVGVGNTAKLSVGILSAYQLYGDGSGLTGITTEGMSGVWTQDIKGNLKAGCEAGDNLSGVGCCNILIGRAAGRGVTTGDCNILLGVGAGSSICTGDGNIILGDWAGRNIKTGNHNFVGGYRAAYCLGNDSCNIMVGYKAGYCSVSSTANVFLGRHAGYGATTGYHNVYAGDCAGCGQLCGAGNVALGYKALAGNSMPASNPYGGGSKYSIALGSNAGSLDVSGCFNIYMGCNAGGLADVTGSANQNNVHIGCASGCHLKGDCNVFLGALAGGCTGKNVFLSGGGAVPRIVGNTYLGASAGVGNTNGHNNVFIGSCAGATQITGSCNVVIGHNVGLANTTGSNQLAIGSSSTTWLTGSSTGNVSFPENLWANKKLLVNQTSSFAGNGKLQVAVTGSSNDAYGQAVDIFQYSSTAGCGAQLLFNRSKNATLGSYTDVADGDSLGRIVFRGYNDNYWNPGAEIEVVVDGTPSSGSDTSDMPGAIVLKTTPDGSATPVEHFRITSAGSIRIGAGKSIGSDGSAVVYYGDGSNLTGVATDAMTRRWNYINDSGDRNLFTCDAGGTYTGGSDSCYNIAAGYHAMNLMTNSTSGTGCNIALGRYAGCCSDGAEFNISIGDQSGQANTSGKHNINIGYRSGACTDTTNNNINIGCCAGMHGTGGGEGGDCNIAIGIEAAKYRCGGASHRNIALGYQSGHQGKGTDNISLGYRALYGGIFCGSHNIGIGSDTGKTIVNGDDNIFMGREAGYNTCHGSDNIMLGRKAGYQQICGNENVFIGRNAGYNVRNGCYNTMLGYRAGTWNCQGGYNVYIGDHSGGSQTRSAYDQGKWNVSIGSSAGQFMCTANSNTLVGAFAGAYLTEGDHNILLGAEAGDNVTTGCCNVFIGYNIQAPSATGNKQFGIGCANTYWIQGDSSYNVTLAGIATVYAATGVVSATSFYGDGSNLTGTGGETLISGITVKDEGSTVGTAGSIKNINFIGGSVTAAASGADTANITITGGAPGDAGYWVANDTGIHTTAKVGIGTTTATPALLNLHAGASSNNDLIVFSAAGAASTERITIGSTTSDNGSISFEGSEGTLLSITNNLSSGSIFSVNDISGIPSIDVDADGTILLSPLVSSTVGYVGVGTTNPSTRLHVEGNAKVTGVVTATDFDSTSDIRLKTNIKPIDDPLSKVVQIEGVSFNWKQDNRPALGVIADQIEKVIPELVHGDDPKTVNYNGLVGLLIEVVKDQQTQIDDLNKRLSKLE